MTSRWLAWIAAAALLATGCGSDLGPGPMTRAAPVRIDLLDGSAAMARGVAAAVRFVGAVRVPGPAQADLIVSAAAPAAVAAALRYPAAHVLLIGVAPAGALPANLRVVEVSRGQPAYLAGALAALAGRRRLAVVPFDPAIAAAARAGSAAVGANMVVGGARPDVVYLTAGGATAAGGVPVIAARRVPGVSQLAVIGPRLETVVADTARLVQDAGFTGGVVAAGLRDDAVAITWLAPSVSAAATDRLQRIEDAIRAGGATIPPAAPAQAQE
jgi:basic membrane lipoprotein Med (substrate-binding protein (PBP1-ABC) superfamily)